MMNVVIYPSSLLRFLIITAFSCLIVHELYNISFRLSENSNITSVFAADSSTANQDNNNNSTQYKEQYIDNSSIVKQRDINNEEEEPDIILQHLKQRHKYLDDKDKLIANREQALEAQKAYIKKRIAELNELNKSVLSAIEDYRNIELERIKVLVKIYENMKPTDAAQIFDTLENDLLIEVMMRMKEYKTALVLAKMRPERARDITVRLADKGSLDFSAYMCNNQAVKLDDEKNLN